MDLDTYQRIAIETDRAPVGGDKRIGIELVIPLLGLAGETGELLSEYKKQLRDGNAHVLFRERVAEELGDLLWYIANVATKFDLTLEKIAELNLHKTQERWGSQDSSAIKLDGLYPQHEQLPRLFNVELVEVEVKGEKRIRTLVDGEKMGSDLTDNAYDPDGYRFHDVFHLAYAAVLGWSPVVRGLLHKKRRSDSKVDNVEDGGRAVVIDEGIAALVFEYARYHNWLEGVTDIDYHLLRTIKGLTSHLEVKARTLGEWQKAILTGYEAWRVIVAQNGGQLHVDLDKRSVTVVAPPRAV